MSQYAIVFLNLAGMLGGNFHTKREGTYMYTINHYIAVRFYVFKVSAILEVKITFGIHENLSSNATNLIIENNMVTLDI